MDLCTRRIFSPQPRMPAEAEDYDIPFLVFDLGIRERNRPFSPEMHVDSEEVAIVDMPFYKPCLNAVVEQLMDAQTP